MMLFFYCPVCGARYSSDIQPDRFTLNCSICNYTYHQNQIATVSSVIFKDDKMLFSVRGRDPAKGKLDRPGGFVNPDEHPEQAIIREIKEELSVDCRIIKLLSVEAPVLYLYQGRQQMNCELTYQIELLSGKIKPADDVADIEWRDIDDLPLPDELAFDSDRSLVQKIQTNKYKFSRR